MRSAGRLENLGFTSDQLVRCRTSSHGVVYVPARVNDEPVQLIFSNFRGYDYLLYESYATDHGLPVTGDGKERSASIETLSAFGQTVTKVRASVWGEHRSGDPPIAGFLCAPFFHHGVVAVDASVPAMAFASVRHQLSLGGAISRLKLDDDNCVTRDGHIFCIGIFMASYVTRTYLGDTQPGPHGRADLTVTLPGGVTTTESVEVRDKKTRLGGYARCRPLVSLDHGIRLRGERVATLPI